MAKRRKKVSAPPSRPSPQPEPSAALPDEFAYAALALFVLLAFALRAYRLSELPPGLFPDEALNGMDAIASLRAGRFQFFYPDNGGREGLMIALQGLFFALFGTTAVTIRLPSLFAGALAIPAVFFVARKAAHFFGSGAPSARGIDGNALGLLAAFFVGTSHWHLNFSRTAFRGILDPLFSALALLALMAALERRSTPRFALAGVVTGLGLYGYSSYRFLVIPILVVLILDGVRRTGGLIAGIIQPLRDRGCWLYALVTMAVAAPLIRIAITQPERFFERARWLSVTNAERPWHELWLSSKAAALQFLTQGDTNWRHNLAGEPALPLILSICFAAGLALIVIGLAPAFPKRLPGRAGLLFERMRTGIRSWLPPALALMLAVWLIAMLLPSALTHEGRPHFLRTIGAIPPVYIITAVGTLGLLRGLSAVLPSRLGGEVSVLATVIIMAALIHGTYVSYFLKWGQNRAVRDYFHAYAVEHASRIESLPRDAEKYVVCRYGLGGREDIHRSWEFQPILFYTRTETEEARRARNIRYLRLGDLGSVPFSEEERHFFLAECPRDLAEKDILATSPNAVIR